MIPNQGQTIAAAWEKYVSATPIKENLMIPQTIAQLDQSVMITGVEGGYWSQMDGIVNSQNIYFLNPKHLGVITGIGSIPYGGALSAGKSALLRGREKLNILTPPMLEAYEKAAHQGEEPFNLTRTDVFDSMQYAWKTEKDHVVFDDLDRSDFSFWGGLEAEPEKTCLMMALAAKINLDSQAE